MRGQTEPPDDIAPAVRWPAASTIAVADLLEPGIGAARARATLD
jgi:hypothetical protein